MAFYNYEALKKSDRGTERIHGKIEAESVKEARELLRKQDLTPVKLDEIGSASSVLRVNTAKKKASKKLKCRSLSMREKIEFTNIMYTFSKSGISLVESLYFIETNSESKKIEALVVELRKHVLAGRSFSEAIQKFPTVFDEIYIGLVRAGEESGELEETLKRLSFILDKQDKLANKVISTLAYPVFVLCLALLVTLLLLTFVFPAFKEMYDGMGSKLPLITSFFMAIGLFLKQYWYLIPFIFLSILGGAYFVFTWEVSKRFLDKLGLRIPVFEKFLRLTALSNFIIVMRVAFEAGVTMVDSLLFANLTVKNIVLNEALKRVVIDVQYGQSLSIALKNSKVLPGIIMCMIATGEESGSLTEMLNMAGEYIDEQIECIVDILSKMFEPFLFVIIGGIVLVLGLSLYLPLFQAYANIG
jgi:type II secretory pathway component PulF